MRRGDERRVFFFFFFFLFVFFFFFFFFFWLFFLVVFFGCFFFSRCTGWDSKNKMQAVQTFVRLHPKNSDSASTAEATTLEGDLKWRREWQGEEEGKFQLYFFYHEI